MLSWETKPSGATKAGPERPSRSSAPALPAPGPAQQTPLGDQPTQRRFALPPKSELESLQLTLGQRGSGGPSPARQKPPDSAGTRRVARKGQDPACSWTRAAQAPSSKVSSTLLGSPRPQGACVGLVARGEHEGRPWKGSRPHASPSRSDPGCGRKAPGKQVRQVRGMSHPGRLWPAL